MAKYVKFRLPPFSRPLPEADTPEGQMLRYLQHKYADAPVEQFALMTELNTHQSDNAVISGVQVRPLSQLFGFKVAGWVKDGFVDRVNQKELEPKALGKMAAMENHISYLEGLLMDRNVEFTEWTWTKKVA